MTQPTMPVHKRILASMRLLKGEPTLFGSLSLSAQPGNASVNRVKKASAKMARIGVVNTGALRNAGIELGKSVKSGEESVSVSPEV